MEDFNRLLKEKNNANGGKKRKESSLDVISNNIKRLYIRCYDTQPEDISQIEHMVNDVQHTFSCLQSDWSGKQLSLSTMLSYTNSLIIANDILELNHQGTYGNLERIKPYYNNKTNKYLYYMFSDKYSENKYKQKKVYVHRLVAEHFLPNPDNLRDVHHIDNNPENNDLSNLMWLSHQDNCKLRITDPWKKIKENPDAYIYWKGTKNKYLFSFRAKYSKYKQVQKLFHTKQGAIKYRDSYFAVA